MRDITLIPENLTSRGFNAVVAGVAKEPINELFTDVSGLKVLRHQIGQGDTHSKITTALYADQPDEAGIKRVIEQTDQLILKGNPSDHIKTIIEMVEHQGVIYARVTQGDQPIRNARVARDTIANSLKLMTDGIAIAA